MSRPARAEVDSVLGAAADSLRTNEEVDSAFGHVGVGWADESACKPGSVFKQSLDWSKDDHPSRDAVADTLMRSTRRLGRAALERLRSAGKPSPLDLAPSGVYRATAVTCGAGGLLHHRFTLTCRRTS